MLTTLTIIFAAVVFPVNGLFSSTIIFSHTGQEFQSRSNLQLIQNTTAQSHVLCSFACNYHSTCYSFDYDRSSGRCRLFQGDLTTGSIIPSPFPNSIVGSVVLSSSLFSTVYNESCQMCQESRYHLCSATTNRCECPLDTYWNGAMCFLKLFPNSKCNHIDACRTDLNLTCVTYVNNTFTRCSAGIESTSEIVVSQDKMIVTRRAVLLLIENSVNYMQSNDNI